MPYTEVKSRNNHKYFYRVISVRQGKKVNKQRIYLGVDLSISDLTNKESLADSKFKSAQIEKSLRPIKEKIIPILKKNKIKRAGIFGSYSRGEQKKNSDVDVLIDLPKGLGLFGLVALQHKLEEKLKLKVDLITYAGIYHLLRERILKDEIRIL